MKTLLILVVLCTFHSSIFCETKDQAPISLETLKTICQFFPGSFQSQCANFLNNNLKIHADIELEMKTNKEIADLSWPSKRCRICIRIVSYYELVLNSSLTTEVVLNHFLDSTEILKSPLKEKAKLFLKIEGPKIIPLILKNTAHPLKSCLLSYIEGELILNHLIDKDLCFSTAKELNKMTKCVDQIRSELSYLEEFAGSSVWNIKNASLIKHIIPHFDSDHKQSVLKSALANFKEKILPNMNKLTRGFVHGDPNDMNILLTNDKNIGFIDWQDCNISVKVYDLSILIFSLMSISIETPGSLDMYSIGKYCLMGYLSDDNSSLNSVDIDLLPFIVQTRIALSLSIGYYTHKYLDPTNQYLLHTQTTGWKLLDDLINNHEEYTLHWKP